MGVPRVSVLMTVYNREKYVAEAIESVLASAFEDFELIIVDDASTDSSLAIARQYANDARVNIHVNERNLGDYPNRNRAAQLARGEYLKYVDADDLIYPHGLALMVEGMNRFPEAGLGISRNENRSCPYPFALSPLETYRAHFRGNGLLGVSPTCAIIRRRCFQEVGGFSGKRYVGDRELWLALTARFPLVLLGGGLVWRREHDAQENMFERADPSIYGVRHVLECKALSDRECPLPIRERNDAMGWLKGLHLRCLIRMGLAGHVGYAWKAFRSCGFTPLDWRWALSRHGDTNQH